MCIRTYKKNTVQYLTRAMFAAVFFVAPQSVFAASFTPDLSLLVTQATGVAEGVGMFAQASGEYLTTTSRAFAHDAARTTNAIIATTKLPLDFITTSAGDYLNFTQGVGKTLAQNVTNASHASTNLYRGAFAFTTDTSKSLATTLANEVDTMRTVATSAGTIFKNTQNNIVATANTAITSLGATSHSLITTANDTFNRLSFSQKNFGGLAFNPQHQTAALLPGATEVLQSGYDAIYNFWGRFLNTVVPAPQETPTPTIPVTPTPPQLVSIPPPVTPTTINRTVVTQPVIERTIERTRVLSGITATDLENQIAALRAELLAELARSQTTTQSKAVADNNALYLAMAPMNRINNLSSPTISSPTITNATISSGSLSGSFSGTVDGTSGSFTTLGVGTTSPSDTFAVNGVTYLASVSAPAVTNNRLYNIDGDLYWGASVIGGGGVGSWTLNGSDVTWTTGNVGIGTTSPYATLSVVGTSVLGTITSGTWNGTAITDSYIDFGTAAGQVSATDLPITDTGSYFPGITANTNAVLQHLGQGINERWSSGVVSGGAITTATGNTVDIASGVGYIGSTRITWNASTSVAMLQNGDNWVSIDSTGAVRVDTSEPSIDNYIRLGYVYTTASNTVVGLAVSTPSYAGNYESRNNNFVMKGIGAVVQSGNIVGTTSTPLNIQATSGTINSNLKEFNVADVSTFTKWYNSADNGWVTDTADNLVNTTKYNVTTNNQATALATMTASYWKKDLILRTLDGNLHYIYGQAQYATEQDAKDGALPSIPTAITNGGSAYLATAVVQNGDTTLADRLYDIRPNLARVFGFGTSGTTGSIATHSALSGLGADDHTQYLLTSGARSMAGNLNLGTNAITGLTTLTATGLLQTTATTEQMRLRYDASNYTSFTVGATGALTITPSSAATTTITNGLIVGTQLVVPYLTATSATATSTFGGGLNVGSGGLVYDYSTGKVGVGTAAPQTRLDITNSATSSAIITLRDVIGGNSLELRAGTSTLANVYIGTNAGLVNTTGSKNVFIGYDAGKSNTTGTNNTFIGWEAGKLTTGGYNTFFGYQSGSKNTTGQFNSFFGRDAGAASNTGSQNTIFGRGAGYVNTSGSTNTFIGDLAGFTNTTGSNNTYIGKDAGNGSANNLTYAVAIGAGAIAGASNTMVLGGVGASDYVNVGIGTTSPYARLSVVGQVVADSFNATSSVGYQLGGTTLLTATSTNTFIGFGSGVDNTSGTANTSVGYDSLANNTTGTRNTTNGYISLYSNTTGGSNTANGYSSLYSNTTGTNNTAIGYQSLNNNTSGHFNTAMGVNALLGVTTSSNNFGMGYQAGRYLADGSTANQTPSGSIFLGASTKASAAGQSNEIVIGSNAIGNGSNSVTLGHTDITKTILRGSIGIGTTTPDYKLDVYGTSATDGINTNIGLNFTKVEKPTSGANTLLAVPGNVDEGTHSYWVTFYTALGETNSFNIGGPTGFITATAGSQQVDVTIPVSSDPRVIGRKIYRTKAGTAYYLDYLLATVADNTSTSYIDNTADASLTGTSFQSARINTTNKYITVNGSSAMLIDDAATTFGIGTAASLTTGGSSAFFGANAGNDVTTGSGNTLFGSAAGTNITTGNDNIAIGQNAGRDMTTGSNNVFVGRNNALLHAAGSENVAVGPYAMSLSAGTVSGNSTLGYQSLRSVTTGSYNTTVGRYAGYDITTGGYNIIIGDYNTTGAGVTVGNNNILIGRGVRAGLLQNGNNQLNIGNLIFGTGLSDNATLSTGNIGIGTTSPYSLLSVSNSATTAANTPLFTLASTTGGVSTSTLMTVLANGRVGVGLSAPEAILTVGGASASFVVEASDGSNWFDVGVGGPGIVRFNSAGGHTLVGNASNANGRLNIGSLSSTRSALTVGGVAGQTENILEVNALATADQGGNYLVVDAGGKIGIGTTTPYSKLTVWGEGIDGARAFEVVNSASTTNAFIKDDGTAYFRGSVGIGTMAPAKALQVIGDIRVGTSGTNGCVENFAGTALTGTCSSDISLKTNIQPLGGVLPGLMQLTPSTFYWNDLAGSELHNSTTTQNYGLIAQDVARVLPSLVATTSNGYLGVNYSMLPILTLQGLKELNLNLEGLASTTAVMIDEVGEKTFAGRFFDRMTGWLADATNGLTAVFANVFNAKEKICIDGECLTKSDIKTLLEIARGSSQTASVSTATSDDEVVSMPASETIIISINGNNPATIKVGDTYGDLGALITAPESAKNFGIKASLDGGLEMDVSQISIDTTVAGTHTIIYSVVDQNNATTTAKRMVNVLAPVVVEEPVAPVIEEESVETIIASSTPTTDEVVTVAIATVEVPIETVASSTSLVDEGEVATTTPVQ